MGTIEPLSSWMAAINVHSEGSPSSLFLEPSFPASTFSQRIFLNWFVEWVSVGGLLSFQGSRIPGLWVLSLVMETTLGPCLGSWVRLCRDLLFRYLVSHGGWTPTSAPPVRPPWSSPVHFALSVCYEVQTFYLGAVLGSPVPQGCPPQILRDGGKGGEKRRARRWHRAQGVTLQVKKLKPSWLL